MVALAMRETGILPDFITVDGGEGGTGAAPVEFSDSVGMPLDDGLTFVDDVLIGAGLRDRIRLISAGRIMTAFHLVRQLALGADLCNSARHRATVEAALELVGVGGLEGPEELRRYHVLRRIDAWQVRNLEELYPPVEPGALLRGEGPARLQRFWGVAEKRFARK